MATSPSTTERPGRKLGLFATLALVMGNMIGTGVFLLPAQLAPFGWNAVLGWIVTIGGALCLAHVLASLAAARPHAVGVAALVQCELGPLAGFLIGFSFWVSVWTGVCSIAVGGVSYLSALVPVLGDYPEVATLSLIWLVTAINLAGVRAAGGFQVVTLLLKLVPLVVVFALIVMQLAARGGEALAPLPDEGFSLPLVNAAAALALWAMVGFEAACAAGDKIDNPGVTIPRATMIGATLVGLFYLLVCSGVALMLPADEVAASNAPFELFVATFWSPGPAAFVALFAAISAIGALNGWVLVQGETPRDMARGGLLPRWLAAATPAGTPRRALLVSSLLASALIIANGGRGMGGLFAFMALLSTCATLWLYLACAAAAARARVALPTVLLGSIYAVWALWGAGVEAVGYSVVLMLAGLPLWWWARREQRLVLEQAV
ncbi:amino acid permease [Altererythrobacter sp. H2]|uniref:APC family permease n=1 Tax=Altererythrobacter sp. H2 TaxID=3108391 RepID=UPI002B4BBE54|nr:amino acid permease [Altererythrobacter sp. H2]WRK95483.1 amino acid permease [Altererythrobacter sp. H2]